MKTTTKQKVEDVPTVESGDQIARDVFRLALLNVRDEILAITTGKKKPKKHTVTETVAYLGKQATFLAAELRKAEAAEHKRTSSLTKALVIEWFRQLDPAERTRFVGELQIIDSRKSGLA